MTTGQSPIQLPPGLPESPIAVWATAALSSAVVEAGDFGFINAGPAQKIVALIGFIGPLVVTLADSIIRHGHSQVTAAAVTTVATVPAPATVEDKLRAQIVAHGMTPKA